MSFTVPLVTGTVVVIISDPPFNKGPRPPDSIFILAHNYSFFLICNLRDPCLVISFIFCSSRPCSSFPILTCPCLSFFTHPFLFLLIFYRSLLVLVYPFSYSFFLILIYFYWSLLVLEYSLLTHPSLFLFIFYWSLLVFIYAFSNTSFLILIYLYWSLLVHFYSESSCLILIYFYWSLLVLVYSFYTHPFLFLLIFYWSLLVHFYSESCCLILTLSFSSYHKLTQPSSSILFPTQHSLSVLVLLNLYYSSFKKSF